MPKLQKRHPGLMFVQQYELLLTEKFERKSFTYLSMKKQQIYKEMN